MIGGNAIIKIQLSEINNKKEHFLEKDMKFYLCTLGCLPFHWSMADLHDMTVTRATVLKETGSPSPNIFQLPTTLQPRTALCADPTSPCWGFVCFSLYRPLCVYIAC